MSGPPAGPTTSLEIGGTIANSLSGLRGLIAAACQDNVQPQAILAVEQLGAGMLIAPRKIARAVDCLGGNDSVSLESVKAYIGLSSGDDEIGTILFEMITCRGIMAKYPVSSAQLSQFVQQLSGHAEGIVPVDMMSGISNTFRRYQPHSEAFSRMEPKTLAAILVKFFESYQDASVKSIVLTGQYQFAWISTLLLWLLEDDACCYFEDTPIQGNPTARVIIRYDWEPGWKIDVWTISENPTEYVFVVDGDDLVSSQRIPMSTTLGYFDRYFWLLFQDPVHRANAARATGCVAQALISLAADHGILTLHEKSPYPKKNFAVAHLHEIARNDWLSRCSSLIQEYGWTTMSDHSKLLTILTGVLEVTRNNYDWRMRDNIVLACENFIEQELNCSFLFDSIINPAIYIAAHAVFTSTCQFVGGARYLAPPDDTRLKKSTDLFFSLIRGDLKVKDFRETAMLNALPGLASTHENDLIVAANGYVSGISVLWQVSMHQRDVLAFKISRGEIRKDDIRYEIIRESQFNSFLTPNALKDLVIEKGQTESETSFSLTLPAIENILRFESIVTVAGNRLDVKNYMVRNRTGVFEEKPRTSWIAAMNIAAMATHVYDGHMKTAEAEQALLAKVAENASTSPIFTIPAFNHIQIRPDLPAKVIAITNGSEKAKFFALGYCDELVGQSEINSVVIQHGASLVQCIVKAQQLGDRWVVIS